MGKRRLACRSRRVLVWTIVTFAACQLALSVLMETCWPLVRFAEARKILQRHRELERAGDSVDVVVLGSSRMMLGVHEDALTGLLRRATGEARLRVLNAAVPGGRPETAAFVFDQLIQQGARPEFVLIDISPENLGERDVWLELRIKRLLRTGELPALANHYWNGRDLRTLRTLATVRLTPVVTYAPELRDLFYELFQTDATDAGLARPEEIDWHALASPPTTVPDDVAARVAENNPFFRNPKENYRVSETANAALASIIAACQQKQIQLLVIGPPLSERHRAGYTPSIRGPYVAFAARLSATAGVQFLDCHEIAPETCFMDGHHLSRESGSIWFADYLAREVLVPRWPNSSRGPIGVLTSRPGQ